MDRNNLIAVIGIVAAVVVAALLALAGSQNGFVRAAVPVFTQAVMLAFIINWVAFIPAYLRQTEHFFDLTGTITYISVLVWTLFATPGFPARSILLAVLIGAWSLRLGIFLFSRIQKAGSDGRFDELKPSFPRFLLVWTLQGLWVSVGMAAALAAMTTTDPVAIGPVAVVGLLIWLLGFGFEVVADQQKSKFRANPENKGQYITTGLWSWSRHPNYFGEIVLWFGIAVIALPALSGWQYVTMISPVFVFILLTRISGVNLLEERADKRWGGEPEYETYKANTSPLVPLPPRKS